MGTNIQTLLNKITEYFLYGNNRTLDDSIYNFRTKVINSSEYKPVFFLSTGRTGTEFITRLLNRSSGVHVFHAPSELFCYAQSELNEPGKIAYEMYTRYGLTDKTVNDLLVQMVLATREQLCHRTYLHGQRYIETNNRITFFAPAIRSIFPNAKFVHLYRHPGAFVRSGLRRGYYQIENQYEYGRLQPTAESPFYDSWDKMNNIAKTAWLWTETNNFIDSFLASLSDECYHKFNFNALSLENIGQLLNFLEIADIPDQLIEKSIGQPVNIQTSGNFPKYAEWSQSDKDTLIKICGETSKKYGYQL